MACHEPGEDHQSCDDERYDRSPGPGPSRGQERRSQQNSAASDSSDKRHQHHGKLSQRRARQTLAPRIQQAAGDTQSQRDEELQSALTDENAAKNRAEIAARSYRDDHNETEHQSCHGSCPRHYSRIERLRRREQSARFGMLTIDRMTVFHAR